ncbi:MAG: TIGR00730 family Rossman fold protein [Bacteroidota bacterium]
MSISTVCIYCASSPEIDSKYFKAADQLGQTLAKAGITIQYGGGAVGLMGQVADSAMEAGGKVIGIIPEFMRAIELGHNHITELILVPDMHTRKSKMAADTDAVIALPGGVGTLEELLEILTWKRLGIYNNPIVLVNVDGYFDPLIQMMEKAIQEKFMKPGHQNLWLAINDPTKVVEAIESAPSWDPEKIRFNYKP